MEFKEGEIQYIKSDRKSFKIEEIWYNNQFKELPKEIIKGQNVKVGFITKNGKNYYKSIVQIEQKLKPLLITRIPEERPRQIMTREALGLNEKIMPYQVADTILMCVKDLIKAEIDYGTKYTQEELTIKINRLTNDFKSAFNQL